MKDKFGCLFFAAFMGMGFVQLFAIAKGIQIWLGIPWILSALISILVAWLPVVGTIAGIKGATVAWGWDLWPSVGFFCWPYLLFIVGSLVTVLLRVTVGVSDKEDYS